MASRVPSPLQIGKSTDRSPFSQSTTSLLVTPRDAEAARARCPKPRAAERPQSPESSTWRRSQIVFSLTTRLGPAGHLGLQNWIKGRGSGFAATGTGTGVLKPWPESILSSKSVSNVPSLNLHSCKCSDSAGGPSAYYASEWPCRLISAMLMRATLRFDSDRNGRCKAKPATRLAELVLSFRGPSERLHTQLAVPW